MDSRLVVEDTGSGKCGINSIYRLNNSQGKIPKGSVVAPIVLASDKTQLTAFGGDKKAWPVYLTISNIAKERRCQVCNILAIHKLVLGICKCDCAYWLLTCF